MTRLSPNWTLEKEAQIFSDSDVLHEDLKDFTIVTPAHTFIEIDDFPNNSSFASSFGASGSYKSYSTSSFKSPERLRNYRNDIQ
jgi:hypothetical protein